MAINRMAHIPRRGQTLTSIALILALPFTPAAGASGIAISALYPPPTRPGPDLQPRIIYLCMYGPATRYPILHI